MTSKLEHKRAIAKRVIDAAVCDGLLVRLEGGRVIERERYDLGIHGPRAAAPRNKGAATMSMAEFKRAYPKGKLMPASVFSALTKLVDYVEYDEQRH
jgi:hypothetical protein